MYLYNQIPFSVFYLIDSVLCVCYVSTNVYLPILLFRTWICLCCLIRGMGAGMCHTHAMYASFLTIKSSRGFYIENMGITMNMHK